MTEESNIDWTVEEGVALKSEDHGLRDVRRTDRRSRHRCLLLYFLLIILCCELKLLTFFSQISWNLVIRL